MAPLPPFLTFIFSLLLFPAAQSQPITSAVAPAPAPSADTCNGIWLAYAWTSGKKLHPHVAPAKQPFNFESQLFVLNNDEVELKSWQVFIGFDHNELLVSASNAVLANGSTLPMPVGDGVVLAGFPQADLKTGIQTAGDSEQMSVRVKMEGTQFGAAPPDVPLPSNITLVNAGYVCPPAFKQGNVTLEICCFRDPSVKTNMTLFDEFLPRQTGDLTIMYDITKAYEGSYWAEVTISNHNPLGRLDYWKLSWDWMENEFIVAMRGAYPYVVDANDCIFGPQAQQYTSLDFSTVLNCQRRPTIVDLPLSKANDSKLGFVPFCCRNGTILPPELDLSKSSSAFQMQVFKMPPNLNRSTIIPPQNWQINGTMNPDYQCGPPVQVSPSQFPDPSGLPSNTSAVASWQVVCNITQPKNASPKCCVSFSAFFNESIIPCKTCACGCAKSTSRTCSTNAPALFIPPEAQLVPFENRTKLALAWAELNHFAVPNPLPCGDNCGVSLNWHLLTDFNKGWTARITLFNWEEVNFADWFVAVRMNKAAPGFEKVYSFNGTVIDDIDGVNNTLFLQGLPDLNYLMGETNGTKDTDPRVPGKQQSVISFDKKLTPGIHVANGDGFPTKVYFNGEECSLPDFIPVSNSDMRKPGMWISVVLAILVWL